MTATLKQKQPITQEMITRVGINEWDVESCSRGFLLAHRVTWIGTHYTCDCEAAKFNPSTACKHVIAISKQFSPDPKPEPAPEPTYIKVERPSRQYPEPSQDQSDLEIMVDRELTPADKRAAKKFATKNKIQLEDLY